MRCQTNPTAGEPRLLILSTMLEFIKTREQFENWIGQILKSNTYKNGWFVYADSFNEFGSQTNEYILGEGLTEEEANKLCEANRYAVEHAPYDYSNIYVENVYDPYSCAYRIYERIKGVKVERARQMHAIIKELTERCIHPELRAKDTEGKKNVLKRLGYTIFKKAGEWFTENGWLGGAKNEADAVRIAYDWLVATPYNL